LYRDYVATLIIAVKKRFFEPLGPEKIPKALFLKPIPLIDAMIARISMNLSAHQPDRGIFFKNLA
jgi:hypothetical protein